MTLASLGTIHALLRLNEAAQAFSRFGDGPVNCPRCHSPIADGFYCIRCGYVPSHGEPLIAVWPSCAEPISVGSRWSKFARPKKHGHDLLTLLNALSVAKQFPPLLSPAMDYRQRVPQIPSPENGISYAFYHGSWIPIKKQS